MGKASERRNELLHAIWMIREGQPVLYFNRKRGVMRGADAPLIDEINDLNATIVKIIGDFVEFNTRRLLKGPVEAALDEVEKTEERKNSKG